MNIQMKMCKLRRMHAWCNFPLYGAFHVMATLFHIKQALRTRSCVLRIFIKYIELLFAAKTIKTKIQFT